MGAQLRRIDPLDDEQLAAPRAEASKLHAAPIVLPAPPRAPFPSPAAAISAPSICTGRIHSLEGDTVRLAIGSQIVDAIVDPSVHPAVLRGACERGEREAAGLVVRALGEVETYADKIISRDEGVHKIVGRILRLN